MKPTTIARCPVVIQGAQGPLIGVYHPPNPGIAARGGVLVAPAFSEEMNRCRSMVTLQAQSLSSLGYGVLILDPVGTGDSVADFSTAAWSQWLDDLCVGAAWLEAHGLPCETVWGIRLGAIMAFQLAARLSQVCRVLLWQPVVAGKTYWTQFLRIRIAAEMGRADGVKTTEELRQRSARGEVVEVSGYEVGPLLAHELDTLNLAAVVLRHDVRVDWFEVLADVESVVPKANLKAVETLNAQGLAVNLVQVSGPAFWHVHERAEAPQLLEACTEVAARWPVRGPFAARTCVPADPSVWAECPVAFDCQGEQLVGLLHRGAESAPAGIVVVVAGGPQYRAGAHRQFVLLARMFAGHGYPVLRFDLRGMGDSSGEYLGYTESRADISAAIDELQRLAPGVKRVMLFGECESATGILFYAYKDPRVYKVALVNPWVRTDEGRAEAILKHYYRDRILSRKFWGDLARGRLRIDRALTSLVQTATTFLKGRKRLRAGIATTAQDDLDVMPLVARTAESLRRFNGQALLLMSGYDYIAREFDEVTKRSQAWSGLLEDARVQRTDIAGADHTFSRAEWKMQAHTALIRWMNLP